MYETSTGVLCSEDFKIGRFSNVLTALIPLGFVRFPSETGEMPATGIFVSERMTRAQRSEGRTSGREAEQRWVELRARAALIRLCFPCQCDLCFDLRCSLVRASFRDVRDGGFPLLVEVDNAPERTKPPLVGLLGRPARQIVSLADPDRSVERTRRRFFLPRIIL